MRAGGARVGVGELLAAHRALAAVDAASRADAYFALRAALCSVARRARAFAEAFAPCSRARAEPREPARPSSARSSRPALPRVGIPQTGAEARRRRAREPVPAAYSDEELLREKDFATYTDAERALARRLLARIARARAAAASAAARGRRAAAARCTTCARPSAPRCATAAS